VAEPPLKLPPRGRRSFPLKLSSGRVDVAFRLMDNHVQRRREFARTLGDGIAVIPAATEAVRNDDVDHEFRQDSDFFFLTGFHEPDAVAIIDPTGEEEYVLFVRPRDREMEIWDGYRAGVDGAKEQFGADEAFPVAELATELRSRFEGRSAVHYRLGRRLDQEVLAAMSAVGGLANRYGLEAPHTIVDPTPTLAAMRQLKTAAEAELLAKAAAISVKGHSEAMRVTQPGMYEYQTEAEMEAAFRRAGSPRNGYPSIVASGPNACILHYTENDRLMADGDLLLIDAAAEYGYYSADITRTFPVNGTFTSPQRAIYEIALAAHQASIGAAQLGTPFKELTDVAVRVVSEGLVDLGLVPGSLDETLEMHHYREYFMHGLGHWLGMDVHDAGPYRRNETSVALAEGMAFTVEPGVYVESNREEVEFSLHAYDLEGRYLRRMRLGAAKAKELEEAEVADATKVSHPVPEEFRGIGVRIEDDIAMTATGPRNLTEELPVSVEDIEALCQS